MRLLAIVGAVVVLLLGGGIYLLFIRGGDDTPELEAGSRFGDEGAGGTGGTLMDALAPVLGARVRTVRGGSDPAAPTAEQLERAPQDAVAGLFMVGFAGTNSESSFFKRLKARPYGAVLLTSSNYTQPQQLSALTAALQATAREAGHPAPIVAAPQEGGEFSAFRNLPPPAQVDVGNARKGTRAVALAAGRQLRALGVAMNLAPNADIAVAGGPGQGRAFSDQVARVTSAVRAYVSAYRQSKVVVAVGPFPGDGAASQDPAAGPAPVGLGLDDLRRNDMAPFAAVATGDRAAPAMQMSNAIYAAWDGVTPATLLPDAVDELRDRIGFEGAIVSADLVATTATTGGGVGEAAVQALNAGVDMLVVPGGRAQQDEAYRAVVAAVRSKAVDPERVADALKRIAAVRNLTRDSREPIQAGAVAVVHPSSRFAPVGARVPETATERRTQEVHTMSTGAIIAIAIVAVLIVVGLVIALPWMRERSRLRTRERELSERRDRVSAEHREQAEVRESRAEEAERRARMAETEAQRERAEAQLHEQRAELHAQGLADDELVEDHEREHFAGTSAVPDADPDMTHRDDPTYRDDPGLDRDDAATGPGGRRFVRGERGLGPDRTEDREADVLRRPR